MPVIRDVMERDVMERDVMERDVMERDVMERDVMLRGYFGYPSPQPSPEGRGEFQNSLSPVFGGEG